MKQSCRTRTVRADLSPEDSSCRSRTAHRSLWTLASALLFAAALSGCGGCQPGSLPESDESPEKKPAAPGAAGAVATKPPIAAPPGLPPARDLPTMGVPRPADGGGMQPPAGADEPEPEEEPEEADCSVIADADPDYGEAPVTVQFSVDYECTESGAVVSWDFGDGATTAGEENPSHSYRENGEYVAVVTVTTPDGATATDEIDITVESESEEEPPDVEPGNP